jgi:hypothetical protein
VSGSSLSEDLNSEVGLLHLTLIVLLILSRLVLTLASKVCISLLEKLLLVFKATLDNLSTSKETLLEVTERFVLDHDSSFLVEFLSAESEFLKNRSKIVLFLGTSSSAFLPCFILSLALSYMVFSRTLEKRVSVFAFCLNC